ncbi:MAG: hypothetical protein JJU28_18015 [Cyclobacteriaceae bacterium]|nr:hypothetical protein [Cyclobacteriaceae bacterium]
MKKADPVVSEFSSQLFWDVDQNKLSLEKNLPFLLQRILEYGTLKDWLLLEKTIGIEKLAVTALQLRSLDDISLNYISKICNIPKEQFRCYNTKQSFP